MLFLLYLVARALARLVVDPCHDDDSKDLEILVLRHELRVLRRKTGPPKLRAEPARGFLWQGRVLDFIVPPPGWVMP